MVGALLINLNKVFPRLPIRSKLAIAFALLATIPVVVTGILGTYVTLRRIQDSTAATLTHDLQIARERTENLLAAAKEDMVFLTEGLFRPLVENGSDRVFVDSSVAAFLRLKPSFVQVRLFTADGEPILFAQAEDAEAPTQAAGGAYYAFRAASLRPGESLLLPVEIRGSPEASGDVTPIPAIAVVHPLHSGDGELLGVAVGEAYASKLFGALESGSPQLAGITGLVGADGHFLYHSERKRDWNSLLAAGGDANLLKEFDADVARRILAGGPGSLETADDELIRFVPLELEGVGGGRLFLYRAVPVSLVQGPARRFLGGVALGGFVALMLALGLAVVAATQLTRPIYQLREGARRIEAGEFEPNLRIETNDELEDLAADFTHMANRLRDHTQGLEHLVGERTEALRQAHAELAEILAHSEDAILRLDGDGRVRVWNRGAEKMFGYAPAEAIGRPVHELLWPPGPVGRREAAYIRRELARTGALLNHHTRHVRKDGRLLDVSLSQTVIRGPGGEPAGCTLIIRDVVQEKVLEKQMLRSERLAAAGRLAAGVAHEVSNPIGIILNRLECVDLEMQERCPACFAGDDLRVIRQQTERVGDVARRLLGLVREEPTVRVLVDLNELAGRVIRFLGSTFEKKALRVELAFAANLPAVHASAQELETVLVNLLLNAADASAEGGVIRVATRPADGRRALELDVADAGCGIPPDLLERIFEPFFTTKSRRGGTGLGLAVTRSVLQAHGGDIRVRSEPDAGSCFTITLPTGRPRRGWKPDIS